MTMHEGFFNYNHVRDKPYTQKFIVGLIGERTGKKWLESQDYEVYTFAWIEHCFQEIENARERLNRRRKQANIERDKAYIKEFEDKLKDIFGDKFGQMSYFFFDFLPKKREIRKKYSFAEQVGGISPDFIVKKNDEFLIVEVKANKSMPTKHQRMCFTLAESYGFYSMILRVTVEGNTVKETKLTQVHQSA